MTVFQWLVGGGMFVLVSLEVLLQFTGNARRSISTLRLLVWMLVLYFTTNPQTTVWIANAFSIGRGADLLLYLTVLAFLLSFFYVIHALERHREQLTALVRQIALMEPYAKAEKDGKTETNVKNGIDSELVK